MMVGPRRSARVFVCAGLLLFCVGCGRENSKLNEPMGYKSTAELKSRLLEVSQYGDGGSSLGGLSESIESVLKTDQPEKEQKLQADFRRLNTTNSKDERKKIAKEMADQL